MEIFADAGATIMKTKDYGVVKIPAHIVEECVQWAPMDFICNGSATESDFTVAPGNVSFSTFGECLNVIDPVTRKLRPSVKKDNENIAKL